MPRVVLTGGPGVGKSTVLVELAHRGFRVFGDSARDIIQGRKSLGLPPRPEPSSFAREILARDELRFEQSLSDDGWSFFHRSALEPLGMLHALGAIAKEELERYLVRFCYHRTVFVFPPWQAIYHQDEERDHSYDHCVRVHSETVRWYTKCGYQVREVAPSTAEQRAEELLTFLGLSGV